MGSTTDLVRAKQQSCAAAAGRLAEALELEPTAIVRDATIQRFEFTFELAWKYLQASAKDQGVTARSPREALKQAYRLGLIDDENLWLAMLESRNQIAHVYNEQLAKALYDKIRTYLKTLQHLATASE